jgi:hypothetical protein
LVYQNKSLFILIEIAQLFKITVSKINVFMEEGLLILFRNSESDAGFLLVEDFGKQIFDVVLVESTVRVDIISDVKFVAFGSSDKVEFHKDEF